MDKYKYSYLDEKGIYCYQNSDVLINKLNIDVIVNLADLYDISTDELLGKEKPSVTSFQEKPSKKPLDKMFFKINVHDAEEGDDVNINLPLALVRIFVDKEDGKTHRKRFI